MRKFIRNIMAVSAAALTASSFAFTVSAVQAAPTTYKVADLISAGKAKTFGRYLIEDEKMTCYWSAGGFEINVDVKKDEEMSVFCETNSKIYLAAFVDGEEVDRQAPISEQIHNIYIPLAKGKHTVRILRDTPNSAKSEQYFYFVAIETAAKILDAAKPTDLYIETIGASLTCGCGVLGTYQKGKAWTAPDDHSAVKSFAYRMVEELGCDYSMVSRGGIGLLSDTSGSQEAVNSNTKTTMQEIYNYTNGNCDLENNKNEYTFERKPDIIIFQMGGNDSSKFEEQWKQEVISFIAQLREKNGKDAAIVYVGKSQQHFLTFVSVIKNELAEDTNLYAMKCEYGGSGSAALATQSAGHPDTAEQHKLAKDVIKFLRANSLVPNEEAKNKAADNKSTQKQSVNIKKVAVIGGGAALLVAGAATVCAIVSKKKKKKNNNA